MRCQVRGTGIDRCLFPYARQMLPVDGSSQEISKRMADVAMAQYLGQIGSALRHQAGRLEIKELPDRHGRAKRKRRHQLILFHFPPRWRQRL